MSLKRVHRELLSRGAAIFLGLALCYGSYRSFLWVHRLLNDPVMEELSKRSRARETAPITAPVVIASLLGLGGLCFVGFALLPHRVLYLINPMYNTSDPRDWDVS